MNRRVILTGLRANNDLHIGNYLGGLKPLVDLANKSGEDSQVNLFIPDLHSFTTPIDFSSLKDNILSNLRLYVAAGLPLNKTNVYLYRQSYIPAHSELTWILDCFTGYGELQRMTQFKDKSLGLKSERISVGLYNYPVLMAADILLYDANYVPVGDDQTQHLEFTRDIAERINKRFGEIFTVPKPVKEQHEFFGKDQGLRIKDLVDPSKKMSKSDENPKGVLFLSDDIEASKAKIISATTDSLNNIAYDKLKQPGVSNLLDILALLSERDINEVIREYSGKSNYGQLKQATAEALTKFLSDFQTKLSAVSQQSIYDKLIESEKAMNIQANKTLYKIQKAIGLRE